MLILIRAMSAVFDLEFIVCDASDPADVPYLLRYFELLFTAFYLSDTGCVSCNLQIESADKSHVSFVHAFYLQIVRDTPGLGQVQGGKSGSK